MMTTKSILIATPLYPPEIGGPATYSQLLVNELPKQGWTVKILNFASVRSWPKVIRHLIYTWKVFRLIPRYQVIYAQDPVSVGLPVCLACWLRRRSFVLKIVGDYAWEQGSQRFGVNELLDDFVISRKKYAWPVRWLKRIQTGVAHRADKIIVPSHYLKKIVFAWGVDAHKIIVIYNAFNSPANLPTKTNLRHELNLTGPILVSAGRLVPWKGFPLLIEICQELKSDFPELKLFIIGEGPEKDNLQQKINQLGLTAQVKLLGRLPVAELLKWIKAADGFVLNTSYEGFSHQLLEVAWCETPLITTLVGGNGELVEDGKTGWLVAYNNHDDWQKKIRQLLLDQKEGKLLAKQARVRVESFTVERMITELIQTLS